MQKKLLEISLAAQTDAVFWPLRDFAEPLPVNTYELRKTYLATGLPWASNARTATGRKQAQRLIEELAAEGSVTLTRNSAGQIEGVRPTIDTYARCRRLCGLPRISESFDAVSLIVAKSKRPATTLDHVWIAETALNRGRGWGDGQERELQLIHQTTGPATMLGWLTSRADCRQHLYYAASDTAMRVFGASELRIDHVDLPDEVVAVRKLREFYFKQLWKHIARRATRKPDDSTELGYLPLPVSMFGVPLCGYWSVRP